MASPVHDGVRRPLAAPATAPLDVRRAAYAGAGRQVGAGSTRTVERALALLSDVCTSQAVTLTEVARRTQLPASTALRLLRTMESLGFVSRDDGGSFRAGPVMTSLGATAIGRHELARLATPALDRIGAQTAESAYLSVRGVRDTAIYVAVVEGTHAIRHTSWIGRTVPMEGLAVGRVLAGRTPEIGYVAARDRIEPDVTAVVAPVRYPGGVAGALSVLGPAYRIDEATMHRYGRIVATEAALLSERLGFRGDPTPTGRRPDQPAQQPDEQEPRG